jgi:hypothetical protein
MEVFGPNEPLKLRLFGKNSCRGAAAGAFEKRNSWTQGVECRARRFEKMTPLPGALNLEGL